ncbi:type II secretion system secretin GspD [Hyphomicrobium sp. 99]|uniref:type II secretion system secretin GspD n=1 Tax=Hyphomicrobium sp. 99 TaxID=1163419 RepID=UPI000698BF1E|nr:type II secretion system secretin GspD [Hyphomicrobium sp. 99]
MLADYRHALLFLGSLALAGCSLPYGQLALPDPITGPSKDAKSLLASKSTGTPLSSPSPQSVEDARVYTGSGEYAKEPGKRVGDATPPGASPITTGATVADGANGVAPLAPTSEVNSAGITINLVNASVPEVAKTILGDILGVNYVVSDKIKSYITLRTVHPVDKAGLLEIFESVLRAEDIAVVAEGGVYKVLPAADAAASGAPLQGRLSKKANQIGLANEIVPLTYVAAPEMERILKSAAPDASVLRVDTNRNLLLISGTQSALNSMKELVGVFDVDWMRGMSFAIMPVETGDPAAIAEELDVIFANDKDSPTKGIVRFIPNQRLKSVLVISSRPEYLKKAETWLARIDQASQATEKQVFVYHVQNRPAADLAQLLQKVYRSGSQNQQSSQGGPSQGLNGPGAAQSPADAGGGLDVSPVAPPVVTPPGQTAGLSPAPSPKGSDTASDVGGGSQANALDASGGQRSAFGSGGPPDDRSAGITVTADEPNNSLVITATKSEYKRVRNILRSIDVAGNQVMIEATIAEVTLTDDLKFGVRWFFQKGGNNFGFNDVASTAVSNAFPGFNYFLNVANIKVAINALSEITDVNVVSSPTLMVVENKRAVLQVGDEVPIVTQQAQAVSAGDAPIINSVSFRNTGVILGITPRVSDDGKVVMEIEQEVSDVVKTTTSTIDSPTIQQRRIKTTVNVQDGQSIVLAGLIQDRATRQRDQVPILGNIPYVGNIFKTKDDSIKRTELLIAITPQVIRDQLQIDQVTAEYRDNLNLSTRPQRRTQPDVREQLDRIVR